MLATKKNIDLEAKETAASEPTFSLEQILASKKLNYSPDILRVVLKPDKKYSLAEVDKLVKEFKSRKVI